MRTDQLFGSGSAVSVARGLVRTIATAVLSRQLPHSSWPTDTRRHQQPRKHRACTGSLKYSAEDRMLMTPPVLEHVGKVVDARGGPRSSTRKPPL